MTDRRIRADRRDPALGGRRETDHGTRVAYQYDGCRCGLCIQAEARYHAQYAKGQIGGWVSSVPARSHLERLRAAGVGLRRIAHLSGVAHSTLKAMGRGQPQIHSETERRILGVTKPSLADGQSASVAASYKTRELLRRLIEEQYSLPWLQQRFTRRVLALADRSESKNARPVRVSTWKRVKAVCQAALFDDMDGATC